MDKKVMISRYNEFRKINDNTYNNDEYYQKVSYKDWDEMLNTLSFLHNYDRFTNLEIDKLDKISKKLNSDLGTTEVYGSTVYSIGYKNRIHISNNSIDGGIFIYKLSDEWFWIGYNTYSPAKSNFYKCDQFQGVIRFFEDEILPKFKFPSSIKLNEAVYRPRFEPVTNRLLMAWIKSDALNDVPVEALDMILSWPEVYKSFASHSFYNKQKSWDTTEDGTIRVADHWNYPGNRDSRIHMVTDVETIKGEWYAFRYDLKDRAYKFIKHFEKDSISRSDRKKWAGSKYTNTNMNSMIDFGKYLKSLVITQKAFIIIDGGKYKMIRFGRSEVRYQKEGTEEKCINWREKRCDFELDGEILTSEEMYKKFTPEYSIFTK